MQSGTVLDQHSLALNSAGVRDLLVLWQHPDTRELIPIGRFGHHGGGAYSFAYTRAAATIPDFRPLPGLSDLHHRYESDSIPAVFEQRVMDRERPDFDGYARTLGLDPTSATPWEQIVESGGRRAGDTLQFMPVPMLVHGRALARFLVNGVRHIREVPHTVGGRTIHATVEQQEEALQSLTHGSAVLIETEDGNPKDPDACLVTVDGVPVGWVPRALSASVRELLAAGPLEATVHRAAEPGTPPHVRLVLDLDAPAPPAFDFDRARRWDPLPPQ
jgi:hypothetical protein